MFVFARSICSPQIHGHGFFSLLHLSSPDATEQGSTSASWPKQKASMIQLLETVMSVDDTPLQSLASHSPKDLPVSLITCTSFKKYKCGNRDCEVDCL